MDHFCFLKFGPKMEIENDPQSDAENDLKIDRKRDLLKSPKCRNSNIFDVLGPHFGYFRGAP